MLDNLSLFPLPPKITGASDASGNTLGASTDERGEGGKRPVSVFETCFAVIDCEATGLDLVNDHPVEVAVVLLHPDGSIEPCVETLIDPGIQIPSEASAIHHLVNKDVAGSPDLAAVRSQLMQAGAVCAAHNAAYDRPMLRLHDDGRPWLCTYRLAMHLWPEAPKHGNQFLRYWLDLDVLQAKGLPAHRAMADALVTAALLRRALEVLRERSDPKNAALLSGETLPDEALRDVASLARWVERPVELQKVPFGKHCGTPWKEMDDSFMRWVVVRDFAPDVLHTAQLWLHRRGSGDTHAGPFDDDSSYWVRAGANEEAAEDVLADEQDS